MKDIKTVLIYLYTIISDDIKNSRVEHNVFWGLNVLGRLIKKIDENES